MASIDLSVIIPTYNERDSVAPLMDELTTALAGLRWEAVFVDDSTDGTDAVLASLAAIDNRIRFLHRAENRGGLAGAVVEGLALGTGQFLCVLDADLQHPPARIPELLSAARRTGADLAIASRYAPGGDAGGLDGALRVFYSRGLKALSMSLFPSRLAGITDPLGGFFLLRPAVIQGIELRPIGYKILLEILVRGRWHTVNEIAYRFEPRRLGESKASLSQGLHFFQHLARLLGECSPAFAPMRLMLGNPGGRPAAAGSRSHV